MHSRAAIIFSGFALIVSSCSDWGESIAPPEPELFEIKYVLMNSGDSTITDWRIDALTYYPKNQQFLVSVSDIFAGWII